ncbi:MAG: iron-containing alcohol dehydrogenase [Propionicimonas sp.]
MKALIFNSGLGNRMGEFTRENHKSMARLSNGEPIFGRQLRLLAAHGLTDIVVTTGPHVAQLESVAAAPEFSGLRFTFVPNEVYDQTNYIYSMYLAREHLDDDILLLHGDLVFNGSLLTRLLADLRPDLGVVNSELPQPEKDFKARLAGDVIREVSVTAFGDDCVAFQPLYKLSRRAMRVWIDRVVAFVEAGNTGVYAENALNEVSRQADIRAFSYAGDYVNEVDTLDDLAAVSAAIRLFDFAEQPVLAEPGDYRRIPALLASAGVRRPLVIGGSGYRQSLIRPYLEEHLTPVVFGDYSANPRIEEVRAGLRRFQEEGCDSIISLGGGSAMDVAKCVKLLAAGDGADFPAFGAPLARSVPHLAIPTTAGTGSESTHFAVVYIDGEKHSIAHDAALPEWVLLEPRLLESLPDYHKKASVLDALAQCVESIWASSASEQSREHARAGLRVILDDLFAYFHQAVPFDVEVTRRMQVAANHGGKAINLTKTTAPHAMSYGLTAKYGLAHGHAAALCLRGVWAYYVHLIEEGDPKAEPVETALVELADIFGVPDLPGSVGKLGVILEALRLAVPRVPELSEIDELVASVNAERLGNSPVPLTSAELRTIYEFVLGLRPAPYPLPESESPAGGSESAAVHADLEELQALELEILEMFDRFCVEHGLRYYLSEGSILGAVRHGGPIPWDDDIDVMMPRADYRRFVELAGRLPEDLNLDSFETNPRHWVFGAKLQLTRPSRFELTKIAHLAHFSGPYIDIFPVDAVKNAAGPVFAVQRMMLRGLRRALFMSAGRSRGLRRNPIVRIPLYLATRVVPTATLHRWVTWAQSEFNSDPQAAHWANLCSYYPLEREVFPKEWFGAGRRVVFGGLLVPVPDRAEAMLTGIYGPAYLGIPTLQDRTLRSHSFTVVSRPSTDSSRGR